MFGQLGVFKNLGYDQYHAFASGTYSCFKEGKQCKSEFILKTILWTFLFPEKIILISEM